LTGKPSNSKVEENEKKSAKAFLATEQRIPGLGNGVLQDILFNAGVSPKTKVGLLLEQELRSLFDSVKTTLQQMVDQGGRDTETDLFGNPGGYHTLMSKKTVGHLCPRCGGIIEKTAYMGGSVYICPSCQKERK
jgi:formamidopyrimidine-DNA glycosylase